MGYSVNSRNAAEFDITRYVKPGENLLAVEVYRFSLVATSRTRTCGGYQRIFRNVTLWNAPQVHMRDFFVKTDLDKDYRDGTVMLVVKLRNYGATPEHQRPLNAGLYDRAREAESRTGSRP